MICKILNTPKVQLTKEELRLYGMVFQRMDLEVDEFHDLVAVGEWMTLPDKTELTRAGEPVDAVYVVVRGAVVAETPKDGDVAIPPGHYVGEARTARVLLFFLAARATGLYAQVSFIQSYSDAKKKPGEVPPVHDASATCTAVGEIQVFAWKQADLHKYLKDDHNGATAKIIRTIFSDVLEKFHIGQ